ncbi:hypothetical protein E4T56_gene13210 [Termitomyces sp. T112]|nr:hypothetical protein E4T56_gene13210 [Termitomyces sp. T112]
MKNVVMKDARITMTVNMIADKVPTMTRTLIATPAELLKVKLQLQSQRSVAKRQFKGPIHCARQIIRAQGLLGMWSGLRVALLFVESFFGCSCLSRLSCLASRD